MLYRRLLSDLYTYEKCRRVYTARGVSAKLHSGDLSKIQSRVHQKSLASKVTRKSGILWDILEYQLIPGEVLVYVHTVFV